MGFHKPLWRTKRAVKPPFIKCLGTITLCGGLVAKLYPTCDPMDCSLTGSSLHEISQARILQWVDISFPSIALY